MQSSAVMCQAAKAHCAGSNLEQCMPQSHALRNQSYHLIYPPWVTMLLPVCRMTRNVAVLLSFLHTHGVTARQTKHLHPNSVPHFRQSCSSCSRFFQFNTRNPPTDRSTFCYMQEQRHIPTSGIYTVKGAAKQPGITSNKLLGLWIHRP
jgi:hypothetical protein